MRLYHRVKNSAEFCHRHANSFYLSFRVSRQSPCFLPFPLPSLPPYFFSSNILQSPLRQSSTSSISSYSFVTSFIAPPPLLPLPHLFLPIPVYLSLHLPTSFSTFSLSTFRFPSLPIPFFLPPSSRLRLFVFFFESAVRPPSTPIPFPLPPSSALFHLFLFLFLQFLSSFPVHPSNRTHPFNPTHPYPLPNPPVRHRK